MNQGQLQGFDSRDTPRVRASHTFNLHRFAMRFSWASLGSGNRHESGPDSGGLAVVVRARVAALETRSTRQGSENSTICQGATLDTTNEHGYSENQYIQCRWRWACRTILATCFL
jgi:hypothetical protein